MRAMRAPFIVFTRRAALGLAFGGALLTPAGASGAAADKPNIVLILADDLGYADTGVYGCKDFPTPHIDSLARNGIRFTNAYVSAPYCSPTRAGLLTGRYQQRFGHEFNPHATRRFLARGGDPRKAGLPLSETTLADRLKASGYVTGIVGKWHLGSRDESFHPLRRGFQEFFGFLGGGHDYFQSDPLETAPEYLWTEPGAPSGRVWIQRNGRPVEHPGYLTDGFSLEAESFIRRHAAQPFFLYLAYNAPHTPLQAPENYLERVAGIQDEKRRTYAAMVTALDEGVGRVLSCLRELQLEERTLVVFLSDNGGLTPLAGATRSEGTPCRGNGGACNEPLSGRKCDLWEGGIRVPMLLQWRGRLPEGMVYEKPVIQLDVFPTALEAAGVPVKPADHLDGVSLLPYLLGAKSSDPHDALYWRFGKLMAIRRGHWKLVRAWWNKSRSELFDLSEDPDETTDLSATEPEIRDKLFEMWQKWNAELIPPLWPHPGNPAEALEWVRGSSKWRRSRSRKSK